MTHEGRMLRGEEKHSKGINDIEVEYYLKNISKASEEPPKAPKPTSNKEAKDGKPRQ